MPSTDSEPGGRDAESPITPLVIGFPVAAASVVLLVWAGSEGGYARTAWYQGTLFLLGLLAVLVAVGRPLAAPRIAPLTVGAVGFLALFVAWTFASMTWADVPGEAWDGANRALLYLVLFCIFGLWSGGAATVTFALAFVSFGVCALGLTSLVAAAGAENPAAFFMQGRFVEPLGYHNGNAAMFLIAFVPALVLSSRRDSPALLRAAALAAASVLLALAVLPQSRASIVALPLTLLVVLAVVPERVRLLVSTLVVGVAVLLIRGPLLDVYRGVDEAAVRESLREARTAVLAVAAFCFLVGLGLSAVEGRLPARRRERPAPRRRTMAVAAVAVAAAVTALAVATVTTGRASEFWDELSSGQPTERGTSHFGSGLGSNRPDMWRVAWASFADHPLNGIGADNFAAPYVLERRSSEEPRYPHSVALQLLSQFGLVGAGLFAAFLACAVAASIARASRNADERMLAAAALGGFTYWLVHGSVDWFWEIPALGGTAFALLGLAVGLAPRARWSRGLAGAARPVAAVVLATAFVAAAGSLLAPWAAARHERFATSEWRRDPEEALASLERARSLNPLSERPDLIAGVIASRLEDWPGMRRHFRRALERNHLNWYAELELAVAEALEGRTAVAREHLSRAERLNPREPAVELVRRKVDGDGMLDPAELDRLFGSRVRERTG